jgi:hypothetical protein
VHQVILLENILLRIFLGGEKSQFSDTTRQEGQADVLSLTATVSPPRVHRTLDRYKGCYCYYYYY